MSDIDPITIAYGQVTTPTVFLQRATTAGEQVHHGTGSRPVGMHATRISTAAAAATSSSSLLFTYDTPTVTQPIQSRSAALTRSLHIAHNASYVQFAQSQL